jgi:hypothetical protein
MRLLVICEVVVGFLMVLPFLALAATFLAPWMLLGVLTDRDFAATREPWIVLVVTSAACFGAWALFRLLRYLLFDVTIPNVGRVRLGLVTGVVGLLGGSVILGWYFERQLWNWLVNLWMPILPLAVTAHVAYLSRDVLFPKARASGV